MNLPSGITCLIFDWDGTLIDSSTRIVTCLREAAKSLDLPILSDQQYRYIIGLSSDAAVQVLYPELSVAMRQAFAQEYKEQFIYKNKDPSPLFSDVTVMLQKWYNEAYNLAIATGKSRSGLDKDLEALHVHPYFVVTKTADETASKPDPQMLREILIELDITPSQAVMIGDTTYDIDMAKAINMPSIALAQGAHDKDLLLQSQPDILLDSFTELPACLAACT